MEKDPQTQSKPKRLALPYWLKMTLVAGVMTGFALVVSIIMQVTVNQRSEIEYQLDESTSYNYGGEFIQEAPTLNAIQRDSSLSSKIIEGYDSISDVDFLMLANTYVENTNLVSTNGSVVVDVDLQKRGLRYEPTFQTEFNAEYILANPTDEETFIEFEFPFPTNVLNKEINNASLIVDGKVIEKPVKKVPVLYNTLDPYGMEPEQYSKTSLYWEGEIPANSEVIVEVSYKTVGLSRITYQGIENPDDAQDFNFEVKVLGSRKYDNEGSLSIDEREYITEDGKNGIILRWDKEALFSTPEVQVSIATLTNPSRHLNEMYKIMTPLYIFFAGALVIMSILLKKEFSVVDMIIMSVLFIVFFPFLHYLVSFNIDPSADILANVGTEIEFSMPLYGAFAISFALIGGLMIYLMNKVTSTKFSFGIILPLLVMSMGFFPLAMTLPEYKYLLVLLGIVFVMGIAIQIRIRRNHQ